MTQKVSINLADSKKNINSKKTVKTSKVDLATPRVPKRIDLTKKAPSTAKNTTKKFNFEL